MKWYFAINEKATSTPLAQHAKLAVRSAKRIPGLQPHLLYFGERNGFTEWMEANDVSVIDVQPGFLEDIYRAVDAGWYSRDFIGHWLRTEICNLEMDDQFILYTDIDVVFLKPLSCDDFAPKFFACAPEFRTDDWSYFNSGVMLMNVAALRADYPNLKKYIQAKFADARSGLFNDQHVYNDFYKDRWSRLDPAYNWKPYWAPNDGARILHLHGPKIHDVCRIIDHRWDWDSEIGRQIGDIFVTHLGEYLHHLRIVFSLMEPDDELYSSVERILQFAPDIVGRIIAEREEAAGPVDHASLASPTSGPARVLAALKCPQCDIIVRITDSFLMESHVSLEFGWTVHPEDLVHFRDQCQDRTDSGSGPTGAGTVCRHLYRQALRRLFGGLAEEYPLTSR